MEGDADLLVSLEPVEALRFAPYVKKQGTIITSTNPVAPPNLPLTKKEYPDIDNIITKLSEYTPNLIAIDYESLMSDIGLRSLNIAAVGTMAKVDDFPIEKDFLLKEIKNKLSRFGDEANKAFQIGYDNLKYMEAVQK